MNMLAQAITSTDSLQSIIDAIPAPVFVLNHEHVIVLVNDALCRLFHMEPRHLIGQLPDGHLADSQREENWRTDDHILETGEAVDNEQVLRDFFGILRVYLVQKRRVLLSGPQGPEPYVVGMITDCTPLRESQERAKYLAGHDLLTALPNRSELSERLNAATAAAQKSGERLAILAINLVRFRAVNEAHGFAVGDLVLQLIARRLDAFVGGRGATFRMGGDEFCVLSTGLDPDPAGNPAATLADDLAASIAAPVDVAGTMIAMRAAIGIAVFPDDGIVPQTLHRRAEAALRRVRAEGGGGIGRERDAPDGHRNAEIWDIGGELAGALSREDLFLAFQPIVGARIGNLNGYEALLRWRHPSRGRISPDVFIPVAEVTGMIMPIGAWVLDRACRAAMAWPRSTRVSVNVSPRQITDPGFPLMVTRTLQATGLDPARLDLEVTETALITDTASVTATMRSLKAIDVGITLDDFGTGWSSLAILRALPFNRLKIDRAFVTHLETDSRSVAIVRTVVELARALDVEVTAEGIETKGQLEALRAMGCDELQGFLIGRPDERAVRPALDFSPPP